MEKVVRNKAAGDIWISMPNGSVIYVKAMTDSAICPVAKISAYLDLLSEKGLTFSRGPIFGPMHADDFSLISQYVAKAVGLAGPKAASYDHRSFQLTPLPESASAPDHDYSTINTTGPASTALDDRIKVEVIPEVLIKEEDVGDWPVCGARPVPRDPTMRRVTCAHCHDNFLFNVSQNALARCPHCKKISSVGGDFKRNRGVLHCVLGLMMLAVAIGVTVGTMPQKKAGLYILYTGLFVVSLLLMLRGIYYITMKTSHVEGPFDG